MKSQNYISLKILTLALLLLATSEVWAVLGNQIPSLIEIKPNETFEQSNYNAKDIFFNFRYLNDFNYKESYSPQLTRTLKTKDGDNDYSFNFESSHNCPLVRHGNIILLSDNILSFCPLCQNYLYKVEK